ALFQNVYEILRSPLFSMTDADARQMMWQCFAEESEGLHLSAKSREIAMESYKEYLADLPYVDQTNREMTIMGRNSVTQHLKTNRNALKAFFRELD
ncbi:MAG TPA: P-aminobenzoate N-oxygenase AurF, partial [Acidobacteriota bacterium]|nr:P-aminobenzoate N-oxygenase AurF [Acidobacteriota bacterium]